jgi:hypothetical protein
VLLFSAILRSFAERWIAWLPARAIASASSSVSRSCAVAGIAASIAGTPRRRPMMPARPPLR